MAPVTDGGKGEPAPGWVRAPVKEYLRYTVGRVIPWSGCAPAEPAAVWPGRRRIAPGREQARESASKRSRKGAAAVNREGWPRPGGPGKGEKPPRVVRG